MSGMQSGFQILVISLHKTHVYPEGKREYGKEEKRKLSHLQFNKLLNRRIHLLNFMSTPLFCNNARARGHGICGLNAHSRGTIAWRTWGATLTRGQGSNAQPAMMLLWHEMNAVGGSAFSNTIELLFFEIFGLERTDM